jgi:hypothetical protein
MTAAALHLTEEDASWRTCWTEIGPSGAAWWSSAAGNLDTPQQSIVRSTHYATPPSSGIHHDPVASVGARAGYSLSDSLR